MHECKYENDHRFGALKCLIDWHEDKADRHDLNGNEPKRAWHEAKAEELRMWLHAQTGEWFYNDRHYHPEGV
jgi:hypothetical protein